VDKPESHDNKIVEIKLHSSNSEYFAKKQSNSFEASADLASQALRKQIIKHKEK
jgi:putative sigma-54 modulation protein